MFDWNHLRILLAIARHHTLSGAARELAIEHSTVGRRLAQLEKDLQTRLFDRTPEGYLPTPIGDSVLSRARAIEDQALALEREVAGHDERISGSVRVTALDACITDFILPALPELHARHPGLQLVLSSEIRVADLGRREADIAIRYLRPKEPNLVVRRLADTGSALYASRNYLSEHGHLKSPVELRGQRFVGLAPEFSFASEEQWLQKHGGAAGEVVRVTSQLALRAAVRAGIGIGILECYIADSDPELVRAWQEPILQDSWWLVVHKDLRYAARIRAVMEFLIELAATRRDQLLGHKTNKAKGSA
jgi:DNA-binding transcriptional LysR family regulator